MPQRVTSIIGHATEPTLAEALHRLEHVGRVEYLTISGPDLARRRLRLETDRGTECTIALARDSRLEHGSVLVLDEARAVVVRWQELPWLMLEAVDRTAALKLGFLAGHHHWRVRFDGERMAVALDDDRDAYLARLRAHLDDGAIRVIDDDDD